jgi:predicted transcriptional regulator of viral defense system/very-short-patch-repair endonuclease
LDQRAFRIGVARQFGVFSPAQAAAHGVNSNRLRRMLAAGEIARMLPGVYRLNGAPRSFLQEVTAASKWAGEGSAVSHRTAAWLLSLSDIEESVIDVTTDRRIRSPNRRIVVHRRPRLPRRDLSTVKGIQVTTMPRTIVDLGAVCGEEVVDVALDTAIRMGMRRQDFMARLEELAVPGRNGIGLVRRLVAERVAEQGLTESPFERRLLRALRTARLPLPVCQFVIADADFITRVDFAYPDRSLIIEADSYRWHGGRAAWERDRARVSELVSRGWRVLLVTWLQRKYHLDEVLERIRRSLDEPATR